MKRKVLLCGVVLILGLLAFGCGDAGDETPVPNAYNGTTWNRQGISEPKYERMVFTSNTEVKMESSDFETVNMTYVVSGDSVTITAEGQSMTGKVTGGNSMHFEDDNSTYIKKQ